MIIPKLLYHADRILAEFAGTLLFKVKLWLHGCRFGKSMTINGRVLIKCVSPGSISIGDRFCLNSRGVSNLVGISNRASFQCLEDAKIIIGKHCEFSSTVLSSRSKITIGDYVKIGGNVRLFDHDYHSEHHENRRDPYKDAADVKTQPIVIEDDVFIGTNSIILKGVHIGARSIIGAGSVVAIKDIPEDSVVAGNPAKIIKHRKP